MLKKINSFFHLTTFFSYFFNNSFNSFVRILYTYFLTFFISSEYFGESEFVISISTLLFSTIFFDQWIISFKNHIQKKEDYNNKIYFFFISLILYSIFSFLISFFINLNLVLLLLYGISFVLNQYFFYFLRSMKLNYYSISFSIFSNIAFVFVSFILIILDFHPVYIILLPLIVSNLFFSLIVFFKYFKTIKFKVSFNVCDLIIFWKNHVYLIFNSFFYWTLTQFVNFYLFIYFNSAQLGIYSIAIKFSSLLAIILSSVSLLLQDSIFSTTIKNSKNIKVFLVLLFPIIIYLIPIFIFTFDLLIINEFSSGGRFISFTLLILLMQFLSKYFGSFNIANNNYLPIFISTFISGSLNVLLILIFSNSNDIIIPVYINSFSWIINVSIRFIFVNKYINLRIKFYDIVIIFISALFFLIDFSHLFLFFYFILLTILVIIYLIINGKKNNEPSRNS
jgi:O-antigen/teichoic acid export membrane protein